jgi:hypothetical protein
VKKIEVCAPVELLEPLRTELARGGIVTSALIVSCGWPNAGELRPPGRKAQKGGKATRCKVELVVSDRFAPREGSLRAHGQYRPGIA